MISRAPASSLAGNGRKTGVSLSLNGHSAQQAGTAISSLRERLAGRSRVTNLGIVLLLGIASMSVLLNLRVYVFGRRYIPPPGFGSWTTFHGLTPTALQSDLPDPIKGTEKLNHLVLVPGHAVWAGHNFNDRFNDENWILQPYQLGGSVKTFWKQIAKGVEIADADPHALLVFSGGQTRPTSLQTEAESYISLALSSDLKLPTFPGFNFTDHVEPHHKITADGNEIMGSVGHGAQANAGVATSPGLLGVRMTTENFALDSYENLIFGIARYREFTGRYPQRITIVGYGMKRARFDELHSKAIRWPIKGFTGGQRKYLYVPFDDEGDVHLQYEGEKLKAFSLFERDMYGCHGALKKKRMDRNPTRRFHPYFTSAPEIADILNWCPHEDMGLQGVYPHSLPWDLRITTDGWGRNAKQYREQHRNDILPDSRWLEMHADRG
jgi:hypothetical protein